MASQLTLNPEVIKERSTSYSSLTDLYEVPIFTNQFEKTIEDYQEKSSERNSTLYQTVFTLEDWKAKDTNLQLQEYLFVGNESKKVMEQTKADENNGTSIYIKSGSILVIGFLVILFYRYKKEMFVEGRKNMQITITLRIAIHKQIDIQVSSKQKIIDILQILLENHVIQKEQIQNINMIKSLRNSSYVSSLLTLEQAKIYNGDTLVIV